MAHRCLKLVAKPNELIAARAALALHDRAPVFVDKYPTWTLGADGALGEATLVLAMIGDQGPELAQNACRTLIPWFSVGTAVLCGTTAGVEGKTELGEVLCAKVIINPEPSRLEKDRVLP